MTLRKAAMSQPFDPKIAVQYAGFVNAAYAMYQSGNAASQTPDPVDIPPGYELVAWIQMSDFILGSVPLCFYGIVAQNEAAPNSYVVAIRGTESPLEWFDDFHEI